MAEKVPVLIRGKHYESMAEASRQIGCTVNAVNKAISAGKPDSAGMGRNWNRKKRVMVDGVTHDSIASAARSIGKSERNFGSAILRGKTEIDGHKVEVLK